MPSPHFNAKCQPFPSFSWVQSTVEACVRLHERSRCICRNTICVKCWRMCKPHPEHREQALRCYTPNRHSNTWRFITAVPMAEEADFMRSVLPVPGAFPSSEDSSLALPQEDKLALADTHRLNRLQQQVQLTRSRKTKKPKPPGMWNETAWNKSKHVKRSSVLVWNRIQVYTFLHFWKKNTRC